MLIDRDVLSVIFSYSSSTICSILIFLQPLCYPYKYKMSPLHPLSLHYLWLYFIKINFKIYFFLRSIYRLSLSLSPFLLNHFPSPLSLPLYLILSPTSLSIFFSIIKLKKASFLSISTTIVSLPVFLFSYWFVVVGYFSSIILKSRKNVIGFYLPNLGGVLYNLTVYPIFSHSSLISLYTS